MAKSEGLSAEERDAVKQRAKELREQEKAGKSRAAGEKAVLEAIAALEPDDKALAEGLYSAVTEVAPHLVPKTYYGMPGFANGEGKIVVFMQPAHKFKTPILDHRLRRPGESRRRRPVALSLRRPQLDTRGRQEGQGARQARSELTRDRSAAIGALATRKFADQRVPRRRTAIDMAMAISASPMRSTIGPIVAHNGEPLMAEPPSTLMPCSVHTSPTAPRITPGTRNGHIRFTGSS